MQCWTCECGQVYPAKIFPRETHPLHCQCGRTLASPGSPAMCRERNYFVPSVPLPQHDPPCKGCDMPPGKLCIFRDIVGEPKLPKARRLRCIFCGFVSGPTHSHETKVFRECTSDQKEPLETDDLPWLAERIGRYMIAYAKHVAAGNPTCTGEQIAQRFSICSACPRYNAKFGICGECGCPVNLKPASEADNKLSWANEQCPLPEPKFLPITS